MFSHTDEIANAMIPLSDVLHKAKNGFLEQRLALRDPSGGAAGELHVKLAYTAYAGTYAQRGAVDVLCAR